MCVVFRSTVISSLRTWEAERGDEGVDVLDIEGGELALKGPHVDGVGEHLAEDAGLDVLVRVLERDDGGVVPVEGAGLFACLSFWPGYTVLKKRA